MKIKVANYISEYVVNHGIKDMFTVPGGGVMHLTDAFGHQQGLSCMYNHNEQASAMAAEAYARIHNQMAGVCVTTGPGATNAITGVLCGYMDSIPMLIFSGQARYDTTVASTGLNLRTMGIQEFNVVEAVASMTKYAVMITDPLEVKYHLKKAIFLATHGRPGPVWLDIPLNVQGAIIETDDLKDYNPREDADQLPAPISDAVVDEIIDRLKHASRPMIYVGNGVRLAGAMDKFHQLIQVLGVPVATGMSSVDAMTDDDPLYAGRCGGTGDRAGNFAIQNSDVLLSLGSRLSFTQVGFNYESWARAAFTIVNDIDPEELKKPSLHVSLPVCGDAGELINKLYEKAVYGQVPVFDGESWRQQCQTWRKKYPVVTEKHYQEGDRSNTYAFFTELTKQLQENATMVVSVGTSRVIGSQSSIIKKGQRFITNPVTASMGYGLPAAIGVCVAENRKPIVMVNGEGCMQMNIQELQTIIHNKLPIKIFVVNNMGYHSVRMTQKNYFPEPLVGVGPDSGDISFPDLSKLAPAYGYPYYSVHKTSELPQMIETVLQTEGAVICEVFVSIEQMTEPKIASRKLPDGRMVSAPLEDMAPFLSREELAENMYIPVVDGV